MNVKSLCCLAFALAAGSVWAVNRTWNNITGNYGTPESPLDVTDSTYWGAKPGSGDNVFFENEDGNFTYLTNTLTGTSRMFNVAYFNSGAWSFSGDLVTQAFRNGAADKHVSILKKSGNWTVTMAFSDENGTYKPTGSTVVFTNESGDVIGPGTTVSEYIGTSAGQYMKVVHLGGTMSFRWVVLARVATATGVVELAGGTLEVSRMSTNAQKSDQARVLLNGGTIKAKSSETLPIIAGGVAVTAGAGCGIIDNAGFDITIMAALGGAGGLTFTGGGTTTQNGSINYAGATAVTPGTILATTNVVTKNNLLANGLVVAGIPTAGQTILTYASDLTGADLSKVTCPFAPATTFAIGGDGNKAIVVDTVGPVLDNYWTGAEDNDLGNANNWSGHVVPTSGVASIFCMAPTTLTKGATFAPEAITFLAGSLPVTINGDALVGIVAITNNSAASHTMNAPVYFAGNIQVKQAAMAEKGDIAKAHVTFAGGAYAAPGCSLESGNFAAIYSRCIFGKYYLASTAENRWTAMYQSGSKRVCLADNSSLYVPYAGNLSEIYIGGDARLVVGDQAASSRISWQSCGEMVVSNLTVTGSANVHVTYDQGTATPGVFKFNSVTNGIIGGSSGNSVYLCDGYAAAKHVFYIGEGGLSYSSSSSMTVFYLGHLAEGNYETIRPWYSDFTIGERPGGYVGLRLRRDVEFCTDDESGTGRTIAIDAVTGAQNTPTITISGSGTLKVNKVAQNTVEPPITLTDTATLAFGAGGSLGTGAMTLGAGTTLALTATSRTFTPLVNAVTLPTGEGEKTTVRIDGQKLKSGDHTILSNVSGTADHVDIDTSSEALAGRRASLSVNGSELVLTIAPVGTVLIVR